LVAGDLAWREDRFRTRSGRDVRLRIFVEHGKEARTAYAMDSLKSAMRWDEERFGLDDPPESFASTPLPAVSAINDLSWGHLVNRRTDFDALGPLALPKLIAPKDLTIDSPGGKARWPREDPVVGASGERTLANASVILPDGGTVTLEDDRGAIPPYDAVVLVSRSLADRRPDVVAALSALAGRIDVLRMRAMNAAVDRDGKSPSAVAEEFLFRGVLLGLAAKSFGRWPAAMGVSLAFAGVHFLRPGKQPDSGVEWWTGLAQILRVFDAAPPPSLWLAGFLSLLTAGLILAFAALRTRSIWLSIGLHAGWIFFQQAFQWLAKYRVKPPEALMPWIGPNVVSGAVPTGVVPLGVLLLTGAGVWFYLRHAPAAAPAS
jgi:membrane protease YdiL (CAAX protease family)